MYSILLLPVYSLFKCFRSSLTCFVESVCLSVSSLITLPQTVTLFYVSLCYQAPQRQCTVLFLFFDAKAWPQSQTDLFTCTTVLHCGHTFLRRIHLLNSIACTMVLHCGHTFLSLSQETVTWSQSSKFDEKTTIPRAPSHVITHYRFVRVTERYTETLHMKKIADLVAVSL